MLVRTSAIALALALSAGTAFAGDSYGSRSGSNQNAFAKAENYSFNAAALVSTRKSLEQVNGADATAKNKSSCGCKGNQDAKAIAENKSFNIIIGAKAGSISQANYASATAVNRRGGGYSN